jgi:hypothetical protein
MTQRAWLEFGAYAKQDVYLGSELFYAMRSKLPQSELWLIDTTVRMFTEPVFEADQAVLEDRAAEEKRRSARRSRGSSSGLAPRVAEKRGPRSKKPPPTEEEIAKKVLGSSDKFAALLDRAR